MKLLINVLLILFLACPSWGFQLITGRPVSGCSFTEDQGNRISETFDDPTDYDESWTPNDGCAACEVDPNFDVSSLGCGFEGEGLRTYTDGTGSYNAKTDRVLAANYDPVYLGYVFYLQASNEDNGAEDTILSTQTTTGTVTSRTYYGKSAGGDHEINLRVPAIERDTFIPSLQTIYLIEVKLDNSGGTWAWRVYDENCVLQDEDGASGYTGSGSNDPGNDTGKVVVGHITNNKAVDIYWDNISLDDTGWQVCQ